nr:hypothetical protein [Candidatus Sigynarchaeota archaeon]
MAGNNTLLALYNIEGVCLAFSVVAPPADYTLPIIGVAAGAGGIIVGTIIAVVSRKKV